MNLYILLCLAMLSLAWGWPARMEQEQEQQQQQDQPQAVSDSDSLSSLAEISDLGSQHAEAGVRKARFLWPGIWAGPIWPSYYYSYHHPWRYSYWW